MSDTQNPPSLDQVPLLPLRNSVLFPNSIVPISVGRARSVRLIEENQSTQAWIGVIAQRKSQVTDPEFKDLFTVGTLAQVVKVIRLNPNSYSVVLRGVSRFRLVQPVGVEPYLRAQIAQLPPPAPHEKEQEWMQALKTRASQVISLLPHLPPEATQVLDSAADVDALTDLLAAHFPEELAPVSLRQQILEAEDLSRRVQLTTELLDKQLESLRIQAEVSHLVETEMSQAQRTYVLRKQLRAIREELGENPDEDDEVEQFRERLSSLELPEEVRGVAKKQIGRLASMQPQSAEYQLSRNYVEWLLDVPWSHSSPDHLDVQEVRRCLDQDHYGLELVKKRIVEFSAIRKLRKDNRGPILLFLGPPGVGKTSLGRSIARAMGRRYERIALGGVRDEAEIRGHRRTYVGALPGRIIQALKKAGTNNPVLVLDEIDKMGADMRGDPAAALLEVLDPEQNNAFVDHYLDVPFDLSKVTFLATANYWKGVPEALLDRMELVEVPGYTWTEKRAIARHFLIPKQREEHGLSEEQIQFEDEGLDTLIEGYTREAGVRGLERSIASLCRETAVRWVEKKRAPEILINPSTVEEILGPPPFLKETGELTPAPGVAAGLGSHSAGGQLIQIEVSQMPGKGRVHKTGALGSVLQEAVDTVVSFVRSRAEQLHLPPNWLQNIDLHVHIPRARAIQDSAGLSLATFAALCSLLLNTPCKPHMALLGELTLRGRILQVEEIKWMILAAHRAGIRELILPRQNEPDLEEIPEEIRAELTFHWVERIDQVLPLVLDSTRQAAPSQAIFEEAH